LLYKGEHIDQGILNQCSDAVGKKRGPYSIPVQLPIDSKTTESLSSALQNLKSKNAKNGLDIPALFMIGVQNYDKFNGK